MKKVRWGVLSTAGIAQQQVIPAFERSSNAEVKAIASQSGMEKAKAIADKMNIEKAYDSYEKLLDDAEIDAVYIPLPNHLHKTWVIEAAKKGKHILCEKPAALDAEEVLKMKQACEENNVIFMEAFMYHFHPQHERVREIIDASEIGDVKYMRAAFSFPLNAKAGNIRYNAEMGGGSMYDIGCYTIHTLRNILRAEPQTVHAHGVIDPEYHVDTDVVSYLTFPKGIRATFDISFRLVNRSGYEVIGTEGKIIVPRAYRPDLQGGDGLVIVEKPKMNRKEYVPADQYRLQVEHISQAVLDDNRKLDHDFDNTLNNMRVMDACFQSIESGGEVKF